MLILMTKPALFIIDMQNDFVLDGKALQVRGAQAVIPRIKELLGHFRTRSLPVFHIVRVHRPDGSDVEITRRDLFRKTPFAVEGTTGAAIIDEISPLPGEYLIPKIRMSAFIGTELDLILRTLGIDLVIITGIQTPNCIRTTVFDAIAYNYPVCVVDDATAAATEEIHQNNIRDMRNIGVTILMTCDLAGIIP